MILTMEKPLSRQLLLAFYIPSVLIAVGYNTLAPVLPLYADSLTNIYTWVGILLAASSIGHLAGDLLASWSLARLGTRYTMLLGVSLGALPILLLFFTQGLLLAMILLILSGTGQALYNVSRHQFITSVIPIDYRGRALGLLGGVFRIGKFLGPLIGGWVGGTFGLRFAFLAMVLFGAGAFFCLLWFMPAIKRERPTVDGHPMRQREVLWGVIREQRGILFSAGTGQILAQLTRQGWIVLIPLYGAKVLGLDVQTIGLVLGIGSAVDMLFFYLAGIIMDRYGRKWAIVPSFIMQGLGVALIPFSLSAAGLAFIGGLIGFANAIGSGTMMAIGSDIAPSARRGEFLSIWGLIGDTGMVIAPILIGTIAQALTLNSSSFAIAAAGLGAAFLFGRFVPETLRKPSEGK